MRDDGPVQNTGEEFDDEAVARAYLHRPPYPDALYAWLAGLAPRRRHALDLGCGPGKLARRLADAFDAVTAVDPAAPMIALARELDGGAHRNIRWTCAAAEAADLGAPFDLAVGGASLHWMAHEVLFPRLCAAAAPDARIAAVEGDGPSAAAWLPAHQALMRRWVERLGFTYNGAAFRARMSAHERWIDIEAREAFTATHRMRVADLIECEHSRATLTRAKLGPHAAAFDDDMRHALEPYADGDGTVGFEVTTRLVWGRPRPTPRPMPPA
jgi:SAM-dependent methyltransferase